MRQSPQQPNELLTIREAAERLRCSAANVYSLIAREILPFVRVGSAKGYRIDPRDLDAYPTAKGSQARHAE